MSSYVNSRALNDLFADVEMKPDVTDRIDAIRAIEAYVAGLIATSLERIAYDLNQQGWTINQIADELGIGRAHIPKMATAYAERQGKLSPFPRYRSYANARDIRRQVIAHYQEEAAPPS